MAKNPFAGKAPRQPGAGNNQNDQSRRGSPGLERAQPRAGSGERDQPRGGAPGSQRDQARRGGCSGATADQARGGDPGAANEKPSTPAGKQSYGGRTDMPSIGY